MEMTNVLNEHTTVLEMKNIAYNIPVDDSFFTVTAMECGKIKNPRRRAAGY